jgi:hypothetical protein
MVNADPATIKHDPLLHTLQFSLRIMLSICDLRHIFSAFPLSMAAFDAIFRIVM